MQLEPAPQARRAPAGGCGGPSFAGSAGWPTPYWPGDSPNRDTDRDGVPLSGMAKAMLVAGGLLLLLFLGIVLFSYL